MNHIIKRTHLLIIYKDKGSIHPQRNAHGSGPNISVKLNHIEEAKPKASLFTFPCHRCLLSECFAEQQPLRVPLSDANWEERGILRGFLCGSQVKNWPACQIIISKNWRLNRIPQSVPLDGQHKGHPQLYGSATTWLSNIIFIHCKIKWAQNSCCCTSKRIFLWMLSKNSTGHLWGIFKKMGFE